MTEITACFQEKFDNFELDVSFHIPEQGITALFGPSGCGKTTILRNIAGLNHAPKGQLKIGDQIWQDDKIFRPTHKRAIGYVFQEACLFPHLSVRQNLLFGHIRNKQGKLDKSPDLHEITNLLGLNELLNRSIKNLSGGEKQRVAIGRALLSNPEILLMDEPLAALDRANKNEILPYLEKLQQYLSIPIIYVSHDLSEVERLADYLILLEKGKIIAAGPTVDLLSDPNLPFAKYPEAAALLDAEITHYDDTYSLTKLSVAGGKIILPGCVGHLGDKRRLRIAASDVGLSLHHIPEGISILNHLPATIIEAHPLGNYQMTVFLSLGEDSKGARLIARITRKSWDSLGLASGSKVFTLIKSVALLETT